MASIFRTHGVRKGDRVLLYMPMVSCNLPDNDLATKATLSEQCAQIPEAVVAMLAAVRIGAVHSVVFGGFAPPELAVRIDDSAPALLVTASCGIEVLPYPAAPRHHANAGRAAG